MMVCHKRLLLSQASNIRNAEKEKGLTPATEFLIKLKREHQTHKFDWYDLHQRKENNKDYYDYDKSDNHGRDRMGLHPGTVSEGCVTVRSSSEPRDCDPCWRKLSKIIDRGYMRHDGGFYRGFLFVERNK